MQIEALSVPFTTLAESLLIYAQRANVVSPPYCYNYIILRKLVLFCGPSLPPKRKPIVTLVKQRTSIRPVSVEISRRKTVLFETPLSRNPKNSVTLLLTLKKVL